MGSVQSLWSCPLKRLLVAQGHRCRATGTPHWRLMTGDLLSWYGRTKAGCYRSHCGLLRERLLRLPMAPYQRQKQEGEASPELSADLKATLPWYLAHPRAIPLAVNMLVENGTLSLCCWVAANSLPYLWMIITCGTRVGAMGMGSSIGTTAELNLSLLCPVRAVPS